MAAPLAAPQLVMYDDFLIEAYCSIAFVPFASVSEQRGSAHKSADHERQDELYGRCRICCSSSRSSEPMLLCDSCDRAFHQECVHPRLKELPKGEWHCSKCTSAALYNLHTRAATVSNLRNVLRDMHIFPTLPLKLRFKMLDLFASARAPRVAAPAPAVCAPSSRAPSSRAPFKSLPPKLRSKRRRSWSAPAQAQRAPCAVANADAPALSAALLAAPARSVVRLARHLQPVAQLLSNHQALHALCVLEAHFSAQRAARCGRTVKGAPRLTVADGGAQGAARVRASHPSPNRLAPPLQAAESLVTPAAIYK